MISINYLFNIFHMEHFNMFEKVYYSYFIEQQTYIYVYTTFSVMMTLLLFSLGYVLSMKDNTFEKTSSYECGFEPFNNGHLMFNIQFFMVGILFMIFDLELAYLFPWSMYLGTLPIFCIILMFFFLLLLTLGFIYEWKKGALDWL